MSAPSPDASSRKCALCGKPQEAKFKPFCSKRCADVDLSRWLKGVYSVPTDDPPADGSRDASDEDEGH